MGRKKILIANEQLALDFAALLMEQEKLSEEEVGRIFSEVHEYYRKRMKRPKPCPIIHVEFYPYQTVKAVMRVKMDKVLIRISQFARKQNREYFEGLAHCLWSDWLKMKAPEGIKEVFDTLQKQLFDALSANGQFLPPQKRLDICGEYYDLKAILEHISLEYFQRLYPELTIGWSFIRSQRRLGHYDPSARTITLSKILDRMDVPLSVVMYLVYHELLHHLLPCEYGDKGKCYHGTYFKKLEKKFQFYKEAMDWLKKTYPQFLSEEKKAKKPAKKN